MLLLLYNFLFKACVHKWETIESYTVVDALDRLVGDSYVLRCTLCGEIKSKRV